MTECMRHGPKDVVETDNDDNVSERELYDHIKSQLEFCKTLFQHLTSSYRKLVRLEQRRREARSRELKERWQEKQRLVDEEQKEVASRMCFVCAKKIQELEKEQREKSRSRSPPPRTFKLNKDRTGWVQVENEGGQNSKWKNLRYTKVEKDCGQTGKCNDGTSHNEDCGP